MPLTVVPSAATSTLLLGPDSARSSVILSHDDANRMHVILDAAAATTSSYSFSLAQYESARLFGAEARGEIRAIWAADGSGNAYLTTKF